MIGKIILASGSPRRRELLAGLGWNFEVIPPQVDEKKIDGEPPAELVKRLAEEKASSVASRFLGNWVLGADTVVALEGRILGKPNSEGEAAEMIAELSGRTHSVFTGVALIAPDGRKLINAEETRVTFRPLEKEDILAYIALGESMDKAGAYAIQERGTLLAERIDGCYFNVVGLPLFRVSQMFAEMGIALSEQWGIYNDK
ncbi:septum formation inhibitor Maf [Cloacibacillus porcorum]|uniref:Maf family protein n=1 Tax=Cloacibacillus porcorum TaxID=1197717 RepID=UPI0014599AC5|nr:Maf family protein [Cloacibacillus porcorum]MCC8184371.1 Maf family protein [Cloacibacillus porcorum]MCD8234075.1 Maf family protein [Cloacibacillus porcorum]MCD8392019.1 Maf family protein [Cloacibacillus porcorum]MCI5865310.1 Maf family protein [Cloacibacillus porcorum]MDD7648219.1 Maf family protein [Cloacibacillus porcorum]